MTKRNKEVKAEDQAPVEEQAPVVEEPVNKEPEGQDPRLDGLLYDSGRAEQIAVAFLGHSPYIANLTNEIDRFAQEEARKAVERERAEKVMAEERQAFEQHQKELDELARQEDEALQASLKSQRADADRAALTKKAEELRTWQSQNHYDPAVDSKLSTAGDEVMVDAAAKDQAAKEDTKPTKED